MVDYGLKNRVVLITGVNNPQGIGATAALAFAHEGAKLVLVYKKVDRPYDKDKTGKTVWTGIMRPMPGMRISWRTDSGK